MSKIDQEYEETLSRGNLRRIGYMQTFTAIYCIFLDLLLIHYPYMREAISGYDTINLLMFH